MLKKELSRQYDIPWEEPSVNDSLILHMTPDVAQKLSADLILDEELCQVISASEKTGRILMDAGSGHQIAHWKIGYLTCWVEYAPLDNGEYEIYNAYTHRMMILQEV